MPLCQTICNVLLIDDLMEQIECYKHFDTLADFLLKQQLCFFSSNDQAVSNRCELG